mmetsp:Transcript_28946/g.66465  ORF Transcript_28946/g.66465 Transcript_28946/m.66465 type:complete len:258 (+) Transcript_28946:2586-3359(+)
MDEGAGWAPFLKPAEGGLWKSSVRVLMAGACKAVAGSSVEAKQAAIVWHYRGAHSPSLGSATALSLLSQLQRLKAKHSYSFSATQGACIVEVAPSDVHKGRAVRALLFRAAELRAAAGGEVSQHGLVESDTPFSSSSTGEQGGREGGGGLGLGLGTGYARVLVAGDDRADESMFEAVTCLREALTLKVGRGTSLARYALRGPEDVLKLLEGIMAAARASGALPPPTSLTGAQAAGAAEERGGNWWGAADGDNGWWPP